MKRPVQLPSQFPTMLLLVALSVMTTTGCAVIGGIFKAGVWVGAIAIILIIGLLGGAVMMISRRD
jgi:hypothetical protein